MLFHPEYLCCLDSPVSYCEYCYHLRNFRMATSPLISHRKRFIPINYCSLPPLNIEHTTNVQQFPSTLLHPTWPPPPPPPRTAPQNFTLQPQISDKKISPSLKHQSMMALNSGSLWSQVPSLDPWSTWQCSQSTHSKPACRRLGPPLHAIPQHTRRNSGNPLFPS